MDNLREIKSVPLTKQSGVAGFKSPWGSPAENRCPERTFSLKDRFSGTSSRCLESIPFRMKPLGHRPQLAVEWQRASGLGLHPRVTTPSPAFRLLRLSGESPFQPPPATSFTKNQKTNTKKAQPLASMLWGLLQELCPLTPWPCMKPTPHMQPSQRTLQAGWVISFHQLLPAGLLVSRLLPEISARIQNSVLLPRSPALAQTSSNASGPPGPLHHS